MDSYIDYLEASNTLGRIERGSGEVLTDKDIAVLRAWLRSQQSLNAYMPPTLARYFRLVLDSHENLRTNKILVQLVTHE